MIVFRGIDEVPEGFGPSAVAIGKFDGVHAGHRAVIARLREDAAAAGLRAVVVTFDRNPLSILRPDIAPEPIVASDRKLELLAECGLDATLMLRFDRQLADVEAEQFVKTYLVDTLGARVVLVGDDFRFGRGGAGNPTLLAELAPRYGFHIDTVDDVVLPGVARRASSTWARELLSAGNVAGAAEVLGRPVEAHGEVVHGHKRGREMGFPTANLAPISDAAIPADGVYVGWLVDHDTGIRHPAAISVGTNPTFDDVPLRQVEAHVLGDGWLELYGHQVTVEFTERLRGMVAFEGIEALTAQMAADVAQARAILGLAD